MRTAKDNFWLDMPYEAGQSLVGEQEADVAIVGGGFTGMASAYFIKQRFPKKRVVVLEGEFIGFGSSGRNTGIATGMLGNSLFALKKAHGIEETARIQKLAHEAFLLVQELIQEHKIACDFEKSGRMVLAESEKAVKLLEKEAVACDQAGVKVTLLDRREARSRFGALPALAALHSNDEGILNPAKFVRGMKHVVQSLGVEVYEHSRCTHIEVGPVIALYTAGGRVRVPNMVMATNAYNNPLGLLHYRVCPFYVYNIVTEPLTQAQMDEFQWDGRCAVSDQKYFFWNMRLTADNRLVFIDNDAKYFYNIERDYSHNPRMFQSHYRILTEKFPFLKGIRVTHQWGGRIGLTFDFLPTVGCTGQDKNIYYSLGYNGHGLSFAQLAGKMIAALMAGEQSDLTNHILINKSPRGVPSAPLTYAAVTAATSYYRLLDLMLDIGK